MPIRCIIACRSILYLHTLLKRSPNELIKRVYLAQKDDPSDGDFCNLVASDLETLGLHRTKTQIKLLLKKQARKSAFDYLLNLKTEKSKMEKLKYETFHLQPYLHSPLFTAEKASLLTALRTRTVRGIRSDFGEMFASKLCPLPECGKKDSLPHLQTCEVLRDLVLLEMEEPGYEEVFSLDLERQRVVTDLYMRLLEARDNILEASMEDDDDDDEE